MKGGMRWSLGKGERLACRLR